MSRFQCLGLDLNDAEDRVFEPDDEYDDAGGEVLLRVVLAPQVVRQIPQGKAA